MERRAYPFSIFRLDRRATVLLFPTVTLLLVAATRTNAGVNTPILLAALVVGVVCLGLPHGSLDPLVARKLLGADHRFTMVRFVLVYALLAALCAVGWIAYPNIALTLFLAISALHFGTDWQERGSYWGRAAYGACVVTVPTLHHAEIVSQIYQTLGATVADEIVRASQVVAWFAIAAALLSLLPQLRLRWRDLLELLVILIGGVALPPLVFFVCYFCLLHSPRHLLETAREVGLRRPRAILTAVTPTVGAALVFAALLWRFLPAHESSGRILQIVFIGLAALTVPHMLLTEIKRLNQRSTEQRSAQSRN